MATRSQRVQGFVDIVDELTAMVDSGARRTTSSTWHCIVPGTTKELQESPDPQDETRLENLDEFISVAREFVEERPRGRWP